MGKERIRIAIVGVGNCASSFIQGISYYKCINGNERIPGLSNIEIGGYEPHEIEVCAAFDVAANKVGVDLAEALQAAPNNTVRFAEVACTGVLVQRGPTYDGVGTSLASVIDLSEEEPVDVVQTLRDARAEILVSYLPVGSQEATEFYAESALRAGCAFVNCIPVFIASNPGWRRRFEEARLPIIGDDVKSQVGATIIHRALTNLFVERGVRLDRTYQLNFGGNSDFLNMLDRDRLISKKISKTRAVSSQLPQPIDADNIHIGPSDFVPWLGDRKFAHIRMEGTGFGGTPISLEVKLETWDSPNSAGVVIDAVRCAKLGLERGVGGALEGPSSYFMKSPPRQFTDEIARTKTIEFIRGS